MSVGRPADTDTLVAPRQDWLYDYILSFLKSPTWRNPILQFMDEHCILFDSEDENKIIYTEIHMVSPRQKFKDMIDTMLDSICREISITPELFAKAYDRGLRTPSHKRIFEQIMACDNFLSFKKLMLKRNRELEEEALKMLQQEESHVSYDKEVSAANQRTQQAEMELAMALSLASQNEKHRTQLTEDEEYQRAIELSKLEDMEYQARQKQRQLEEERKSLEQKHLEMLNSMQAMDQSKRREIEEAKLREAGLTREEVLAQERTRLALLRSEEEARRVEEEKASIEQLRLKMVEQEQLMDETKRREIASAKRTAEEEARAQAEVLRQQESQKTAEQRRQDEAARARMMEEMRQTEEENRWQTAVLEATKRGLKPSDPGYPVRSLPGFGLLPGQAGYPIRPGEEGYGVVAGLPVVPDEEARWRNAVAAAQAAGLKPGQAGYPVRNLPAFGLKPNQQGYPYREGEVGYGVIAGVSGFTDEARRWQEAIRVAESAGLRPGMKGYPVRDQPAFGLQPTDAAYPYKPGEQGYGVVAGSSGSADDTRRWQEAVRVAENAGLRPGMKGYPVRDQPAFGLQPTDAAYQGVSSAAEEARRWQEAVRVAENAGLRPGMKGYPVRNQPAFGLQPTDAAYPYKPGEQSYGVVAGSSGSADDTRRWQEAVKVAESAGLRPGMKGYPLRDQPAFGLQPTDAAYPYKPGEQGYGVVAGSSGSADEARRWQEAVQVAESAGLRPGMRGYPVRNQPAFGLQPTDPAYPYKPGEQGYGEALVPEASQASQPKAAQQEAKAKAVSAKAKKPEPRQPTEEEKRQKALEEKKVEDLRRLREREAEDETRKAREQEWKRQQEEAAQHAKEKTALPPVQLKKAGPIGEIPLSELQRGKVDISSEQLEAENLRRKAEDILRANETTEVDAPERSGVESLAKRQQRLRNQRDLLLAKKKAERERELKEYLDQGGQPAQPEQAVQGEELEKRKHIASKIKQSLLSS